MTKKDVKYSLAVQVMSTNRSCQQKSRKSAGVLLSVKKQITKYIRRGLGGHQEFLIGDMRRRGSLRDKSQPEVVDDAIDHGIVGEESDESLALA